MFQNSDGKLGIGETSPTAPLHVKTASTIGNTDLAIIKGETTSNSTRAQLYLTGKTSGGADVTVVLGGDGDADAGNLFTKTNHKLGFATNNAAPQMVLDTSGNVGIGTVNPSKALDIVGTGSVLIKAKRDNTGTASGGVEIGNNDRTWTLFGDNDYFTLYDNGSSSSPLVIKNDGKVGIGTGAPNEILQINQAGAVQTIIGSTNGGGAWLVLDGDANGDGRGTDYASILHSSDGLVLSNRKTTPIVFKNWIGGTETEALRISDGDTKLPDDKYLKFGTSNDLTIRHASGNNYINSLNNSSLYLQQGGSDALEINSNGQIGINMAPAADAQFCIKNSNDSSYNVLDVYNSNGNNNGGFSQSSTGNGSIFSKTDAGVIKTFFRSDGVSYINGGNFGLNQTNPTSLLHCNGTAKFEDNISMASGKGINFSAQTGTSATGAATTAAPGEVLDHYAEGTWTPAVGTSAGTGFSAQAYETQDGWYTKIGNLVTAQFYIHFSTTGTTTTDGNRIRIYGLPFDQSDAARSNAGGVISFENLNSINGVVEINNVDFNLATSCYGRPGENNFDLYQGNKNYAGTNGASQQNKFLIGQITYKV